MREMTLNIDLGDILCGNLAELILSQRIAKFDIMIKSTISACHARVPHGKLSASVFHYLRAKALFVLECAIIGSSTAARAK